MVRVSAKLLQAFEKPQVVQYVDLDRLHSFLAAIVANPHDSAIPAICADFMGDHDDNRHDLMRILRPRPADLYPRVFDSRRDTNIKVIKVAGPPNVVTPLYGLDAREPCIWYVNEMLFKTDGRKLPRYWASSGNPSQMQLLDCQFEYSGRGLIGTRSSMMTFINGAVARFYPNGDPRPMSSLRLNGACARFEVDFQLRMFRAYRPTTGHILSERFWEESYPTDPLKTNFKIGEGIHYFYQKNGFNVYEDHIDGYFCCGTLRDPVTAVKLSLVEVLPDHAEFINAL